MLALVEDSNVGVTEMEIRETADGAEKRIEIRLLREMDHLTLPGDTWGENVTAIFWKEEADAAASAT